VRLDRLNALLGTCLCLVSLAGGDDSNDAEQVATFLATDKRVTLPVSSSPRQRSGVAGCFLNELHAGGQAKFGVDVGQVGLHGAR
jgi:hypothetical protein